MMQQERSRLTAVREPEPNVGQSTPRRSTPRGGFRWPRATRLLSAVGFIGASGTKETPAWHLARLQLGSKASL